MQSARFGVDSLNIPVILSYPDRHRPGYDAVSSPINTLVGGNAQNAGKADCRKLTGANKKKPATAHAAGHNRLPEGDNSAVSESELPGA
jgi:hypothetical protein